MADSEVDVVALVEEALGQKDRRIRVLLEDAEQYRAKLRALEAERNRLREELRAEKAAAVAADSSWVPPRPAPPQLAAILQAVIDGWYKGQEAAKAQPRNLTTVLPGVQKPQMVWRNSDADAEGSDDEFL